MNDMSALVIALIAGIVLGTMFFGGLWWTVQKGMTSKRPVLWFFGSMLLRTSLALVGFYFVANGDWEKLLVSLLGFILARFVIMRRTPASKQPTRLAQGVSHAP